MSETCGTVLASGNRCPNKPERKGWCLPCADWYGGYTVDEPKDLRHGCYFSKRRESRYLHATAYVPRSDRSCIAVHFELVSGASLFVETLRRKANVDVGNVQAMQNLGFCVEIEILDQRKWCRCVFSYEKQAEELRQLLISKHEGFVARRSTPKLLPKWFRIVAVYPDGSEVDTALIAAPTSDKAECKATDCEEFGVWIERHPRDEQQSQPSSSAPHTTADQAKTGAPF